MNILGEKWSLDDLTIVPNVISTINSRNECKVFDNNGFLPLFTAPMNTVIDEKTFKNYEDNKVYGILPRTVSKEIRLKYFKEGNWIAIGLDEFSKYTNSIDIKNNNIQYKLLIDIANGHMLTIFEKVKKIKKSLGDKLLIMLGNIANPKTIEIACQYNVDFMRVGIGGGNGCITSSNTGIHYPMASLISEAYDIRKHLFESDINASQYTKTKIVADGGMKNYSDVIKSLALGADYVMCGTLFAKTMEAPAVDGIFEEGNTKYKNFYGMSTKHIQKLMGKDNLKTSEGVIKRITIEYTLSQWLENFESYLKSAMSYTCRYNLKEFIGNVELVKVNNNNNLFNK